MSWVTEIGEIPVMTSFTLQQLSLTMLLTFTSEMKWQPQPAAHVLSGLIRSEAFNANLLWTFHLYHSLCPEYNCIYNQWYFIQTQPRWRFVSYYLFCFCIIVIAKRIGEDKMTSLCQKENFKFSRWGWFDEALSRYANTAKDSRGTISIFLSTPLENIKNSEKN